MSDARKRLAGAAKGGPSKPDRTNRRYSSLSPSEKVGPDSRIQRNHPNIAERNKGPGGGKGSKGKNNLVDRSASKQGGRSDIGKKPIPRTPAERAGRQYAGGNRSRIQDARKRLIPEKDAHTRAVPNARNRSKAGFHDRLAKGEFAHQTAGKTARSIRLADQYRMVREGDVARRMGLHKLGHHPNLHCGPISPRYKQHCFKHRYWGPSLFVGIHWYPRWSTWVEWSWGRRCRPYWDPRPICCRPVVIYEPCPAWVYWETPLWTPLPAAVCGTWVDLTPAAIADPRYDLQLVAVRFVDPGHPEEKLGPRYRVWFRNNGNRPIARPFDVMLFAGNEERLAADLPQAGVRVTTVEAGQLQSVDIRLPIEVYEMGRDAQGNPTPFTVLHVLVDAGEEIAETTKANNGASLPPADVLPVDPAAFELEPVAAKSGAEVLLAGEGFGPQPGRILLVVGGKEIDAEILGWYDLGVRFTLPKLVPAGPTEAEVIVVRGDGAAANPLKITLLPE